MKRKATLFLAGLAAAVTMGASTASAQPLLLDVDNDFFYNNFESLFDSAGIYKAPGTAVAVGDHLLGIINVQNIDANGTTHWFSGPTDQITGVFVQRVEAVYPPTFVVPGTDPFDPLQTNFTHITLGLPTISGFTHPGLDGILGTGDDQLASTAGVLGAGEILALYHQTGVGTTTFESNGTMADDLTKATDGNLLFSLGLTPGTGFFYTHANLPVVSPLVNFSGESWAGLNVVANNTGFPTFLGLNDPNETEMGGAGLLTDAILSSELEPNVFSIFHPNATVGTSPWDFRSNDPGTIHPTPEPSTLVLLGAGLLGLGAYTRKKFKK